jgi:hypothetical protein
MDNRNFEGFLNFVKESLMRQDTVMRTSVSAEERFVATLRFLTTGTTYKDLKFLIGIFAQVMGYIAPETCRVIYKLLRRDYTKVRKLSETILSFIGSYIKLG